MRAAIYARTSTYAPWALVEQITECLKGAAQRGYEVATIAYDMGHGGRGAGPAFRALIEEVESQQIPLLLVPGPHTICYSRYELTRICFELGRRRLQVEFLPPRLSRRWGKDRGKDVVTR